MHHLWCKQQRDLSAQGRLVVFETPDIIAARFDNLDAQAALRQQSIASHDHTRQVKLAQEFWRSHNLVFFLIHRDLCQHHAILGPIRGEKMHPTRAAARDSSPECLAIQRNHDACAQE